MKGESAETCLPPRLARPCRNRIWLGALGFDVGAAAPAPGRPGSLGEADLKGQPRPSAALPGPARRRRREGRRREGGREGRGKPGRRSQRAGCPRRSRPCPWVPRLHHALPRFHSAAGFLQNNRGAQVLPHLGP